MGVDYVKGVFGGGIGGGRTAGGAAVGDGADRMAVVGTERRRRVAETLLKGAEGEEAA